MIPFDLEHYERKEHFKAFLEMYPCFVDTTVELDVTNLLLLKEKYQVNFYSLILHALSYCINEKFYFKFFVNDKNEVFLYDKLDVSYTIFHKENNTFSSIYTEYDPSFKVFNTNYLKDKKEYGNKLGYLTKWKENPNFFYVSAIPNLNFKSFNVHVKGEERFLQPTITLGRFTKKDDKYLMPMSFKIHHSALDGYHIALFFADLQKRINTDFVEI